jgi:hypothetical protein
MGIADGSIADLSVRELSTSVHVLSEIQILFGEFDPGSG